MKVRKSLRRLKRMAYLGALTGTVVGVRRMRNRGGGEPGRTSASPTWPPLESAATNDDGRA